jgi:hypothetical protein
MNPTKQHNPHPRALKNLFFSSALFPGILLFCIIVFPVRAFAGLILDAELRLTYEDNVVGLVSDQRGPGGKGTTGMTGMSMAPGMGNMGRGNGRYLGSGSGSTLPPDDFSATIFAEVGGFNDAGKNTSIFAKGFAEHTSYETHTDLDDTIGGLSAGIIQRFGDTVVGGASIYGKVKEFGDSNRNGGSFGGTLTLKEKLTPVFWLREFADYENNSANSAFFSYIGTKIGAGAGYILTKTTFMTFGYTYLLQKFDQPTGFDLKTQTLFVTAEHALAKSWAIGGEYDLSISKDNIGNSTTDNIFSLALRYVY